MSTAVSADGLLKLLQQGIAVIWDGDFHQGRQLMLSVKRRLVERLTKDVTTPMPERFHKLRMMRSQQARLLGSILLSVEPGWQLTNRRAPKIDLACEQALGQPLQATTLMPMTELLGILSAYQWHLQGVPIAALESRIHPRHGVFAPTRQEYLPLVAQAPLPAPCLSALDLGTGTGVIAIVLARRGISHVVGIDLHPQPVKCAQDNVHRLGLTNQITITQGDLMTNTGRFDLIVCNPPWLPGIAHNALEAAIYDPDHRMLKGFLAQASHHLTPHGQAWLIMSDLAEHLGLRKREDLPGWISGAGLKVLAKHDTRPSHPKTSDSQDPLAYWRAKEVTSLWQLSLA